MHARVYSSVVVTSLYNAPQYSCVQQHERSNTEGNGVVSMFSKLGDTQMQCDCGRDSVACRCA